MFKIKTMKSQINFLFCRKYFFLVLAFIGFGISALYLSQNFKLIPKNENSQEILQFSSVPAESENENRILSEFDPNELSKEQWLQLGFSEKQAETILKYKNVVGGKFVSKEQFRKCYSVSEKKYLELEPYILLSENSSNFTKNSERYFSSYSKKELKIPGKFNPDEYSEQNWINLGFSEKQAAAILKYKKFLGGSFISKKKLKECFVISDENFRKLQPFLLLPEKSPENYPVNYSKTEKTKIAYRNFDPNELDMEGWKNLGFSEKQAAVILNYKTKILKGNFRNAEDLQNCFVVSEEKFNELKPYIFIENKTVSENHVSEKPAKEISAKTDFSKTDINTITFKQLTEFGFDEKAAGSFIGFRNKLGGFVNKDQVLETYNIDKELMQKLLAVSSFKTDEIRKYKISEAPEKWLKEHPYFKYYADKIIYYRISFQDDKKILKMMKLKPETEARMKLYLL